MTPIVLDTNFEVAGYVDVFTSFIWTERMRECGDFEIYVPYEYADLNILVPNNYVALHDTDCLMIIESIEIQTDNTDGASYVLVSGRSIESILDRRIIWGQTMLKSTFQNGIQKLLNENIINPSNASRRISNFVFIPANDVAPFNEDLEVQYFGENLYDMIVEACAAYDCGFKIRLDNQKRFAFSLFAGVDRSYDQDTNPWIAFSPEFENLSGSNYFESYQPYKTAVMVAGEGETADRVIIEVNSDSTITGLNRRESYVDSSSVSKFYYDDDDERQELTEREYEAQLVQSGEDALADATISTAFEGQIETNRMYKYGTDYFIGDLVQVINEFGLSAKCRVSEVVRSSDDTGESTSITFEQY